MRILLAEDEKKIARNANPEKVNAEYLNGILTVKIGKLEAPSKEQAIKKVEMK